MPHSKLFSRKSRTPRFPSEITEEILSYCDGATLFSAKQADAICSEIVETRIQWQSKCRNELPPSALQELLLKMYPKYWFDREDYPISWMDVYEAYLRCNKFKPGKPVNVLKSSSTINCLEVSGEVIFVGTATGVQALNFISNNLETVLRKFEATSIEVLCDPRRPLVNEIYDGCLHDHIDILLRADYHLIVCLHVRQTQDYALGQGAEKTFSRHYKDLSVWITDAQGHDHGPLTTLSLYKDNRLMLEKRDLKIIPKQGIGLSENTISYLTFNGEVETRNHNLEVLVVHENFQRESPGNDDCPCSCISGLSFKLTFWWGEVLIAITVCSRMYVNIKNKKAIHDPLNKTITAVTLYQNILLLGTDVGVVYLYQIQTVDDLLCLDMDVFEASIDVTDHPIKCLKFYQKGPIPGFFVAAKNELYQIPFDVSADFLS